MMRPEWTATLVCAVCSTANAGAVIRLFPEVYPPYHGGEFVSFDIALAQDPGGQDRFLRYIAFDFTASDPSLFIESFYFDSGIYHTSSYAEFLRLPRPAAVYVFPGNYGTIFRLPGSGTMRVIGGFTVRIPHQPGTYVLDVATPDLSDPANSGAHIIFGFGMNPDDPITEWDTTNGELRGGTFTLTVIPEPATATLLGVAGAGLFFRRRRAWRAPPP